MLEMLVAADGGVVSAEELLDHVWDVNADPFSNTVSVTVSRLRKKLGGPPLIETLVGSGYRLRDQPEPAAMRIQASRQAAGAASPCAALQRPVPACRGRAARHDLRSGRGHLADNRSPEGGQQLHRRGELSGVPWPEYASQARTSPAQLEQCKAEANAAGQGIADAAVRAGRARPCTVARRSLAGWPRWRWSRRCSAGSWPGGCCGRCTRSPRLRAARPRRTWASGLPWPAGDELKELADTFDAMLGLAGCGVRQPAPVRRERLARAAHTADRMRTAIDVTLAKPSGLPAS